ncbi:tetratricopeptide repeat protein [Candidatus Berkelbacteria bacterium]|nr:tetratricopeptide repeat protein [Candidatus Berkelbacteria bacterium]
MIFLTLDRFLVGLLILAAGGLFLLLARRLPLAWPALKDKETDTEKKESGFLSEAEKLFKTGAFNEAEEIYLKIAAAEPTNARIYNRLGIIYLEQKNYNDAVSAFQQAIKIDPEVALRHVNLGLAYLGLKKYTLAKKALERAVAIEPKNKKYQQLFKESGIKIS